MPLRNVLDINQLNKIFNLKLIKTVDIFAFKLKVLSIFFQSENRSNDDSSTKVPKQLFSCT